MEYVHLPRIRQPSDLKKLSDRELQELAQEIRHEIIETVTRNGGHLGSNLGVVELTLALNLVFDGKRDLLIWDGSYQTYTHKMLTGRFPRFRTLRTYGGLCGFAWKPESPDDPFNFGHVGTSLATAYGAALADRHLNRNRKVVAIIGDGSLTSGVAFEALNNIGASQLPVLTVLNDNGFSIARTVGAIARYMTELRSRPVYSELKREIHEILNRLPLGATVEEAFDRLRKGLLQALFPNLFTAFGFRYYGPIDGHDRALLVRILRNVRSLEGPVLLHVITKKGCGHPDADRDPFGLHKPVEPKLPGACRGSAKDMKLEPGGKPPPSRGHSYTRAFIDALSLLAAKDPRIVAITAAMPDGTGLLDWSREFPGRMYDVGISEQCAIGTAAGLAQAGMKPVCAIYSTFLQRAFDIIFQELCLNRLPAVLLLDRAGVAGEDGPTHHGFFDIAYLRTLPETVLMAPKDEAELHQMLAAAFSLDRVGAIRIPRENVPDFSNYSFPQRPLEIGKGEILFHGKHGMILAYGAMVARAIEAREILANEGIDIGVANARFAKPVDGELVSELLRSYPFVLTAEDHSYLGGFGAAVMEEATLRGADAGRIRMVAAPDRFIEHGARDLLLELLGMDAQGLARACRTLCANPRAAGRSFLVNEMQPAEKVRRVQNDPYLHF